jgi:UDP-glucose 4-epimerase
MKILLTGGAGYIGSVTTKELLDRNHEVTVIDHLIEGHREALDKRIDFIEGNIGDAKVLKKAFSKKSYDAVMHFAASCLVSESVDNPSLYYQNNVLSSLVLLEAMRENNTPKIIFSSSCAIYGEPDEMPITENSPRNPTHPYGETKLAFERILKWYSRAYAMKAISLRYFNAAGATDELGEDHAPETHLVPNVLKAAMGQIPYVEIYGTDYLTQDGTCVRDYIHILDIAEAHILALNIEESDSFNLGNGNGYSVLEVIQTAEKVCGTKIPTQESKRRPGDPACLIASSKKIQDELGWFPKYPKLKNMISSAWQWLQKYPDGYGQLAKH